MTSNLKHHLMLVKLFNNTRQHNKSTSISDHYPPSTPVTPQLAIKRIVKANFSAVSSIARGHKCQRNHCNQSKLFNITPVGTTAKETTTQLSKPNQSVSSERSSVQLLILLLRSPRLQLPLPTNQSRLANKRVNPSRITS